MRDWNRKYLSENEQQLYTFIKQDPYISQKDLSKKMGLSRSSVANMISGLVKKGHIHGKAYILNEKEQVICIGGANLDRKVYTKSKLHLGTSNPVKSEQSAGGVARNVAENLGRLGMDTTLLTAGGMDAEWQFIETASTPFIRLNHTVHLPDMSTGSYTALLDQYGELIVALADMDVYERITPDYVMTKAALLMQAELIVADLNCPKETLQQLCHFAKNHDIPLAYITVSSPKMSRMPDHITGLTWVITNVAETEAYLNVNIKDQKDWQEAAEKWLGQGVLNVVITNGNKGAMIGNKQEGIHHIPSVEPKEIKDVTGAGDAFSSAVLFGWMKENKLMDIAKAGVINAAKTLQSTQTVRQDLTATQLHNDMEAST